MAKVMFAIASGMTAASARQGLTIPPAGDSILLAAKSPKKGLAGLLSLIGSVLVVLVALLYWGSTVFVPSLTKEPPAESWSPGMMVILIMVAVGLFIYGAFRQLYYNGSGVVSVIDDAVQTDRTGLWNFHVSGMVRKGSFEILVPLSGCKTAEGKYGAPDCGVTILARLRVNHSVQLLRTGMEDLAFTIADAIDNAWRPQIQKYAVETMPAAANKSAGVALELLEKALVDTPLMADSTSVHDVNPPSEIRQKMDADAAEIRRKREENEAQERKCKSTIADLAEAVEGKTDQGVVAPDLLISAIEAVRRSAGIIGDEASLRLESLAVANMVRYFEVLFSSAKSSAADIQSGLLKLDECANANYLAPKQTTDLQNTGDRALVKIQQRAAQALTKQGRVGAEKSRQGTAVLVEMVTSEDPQLDALTEAIEHNPARVQAAAMSISVSFNERAISAYERSVAAGHTTSPPPRTVPIGVPSVGNKPALNAAESSQADEKKLTFQLAENAGAGVSDLDGDDEEAVEERPNPPSEEATANANGRAAKAVVEA